MIIFTYHNNNTCKDYHIYENYKEFTESNNKLITNYVDLDGDYYKTINGYYIPIFPIPIKTKKLTKYNMITYKLVNGQYLIVYYNDEKQVVRHIKYDRFYSQYNILPKKIQLVAKLISKGWDIYKTIKFLYPNKKFKYRQQLISKLLNNQNFIDTIGDVIMKSYSEIAIAKGADREFIINKLKEIADDNKANPKLREFALIQLIQFNRDIQDIKSISNNYDNILKKV